MSVEIIPAIIAKNFTELKEKVELVEPYVKWAQLDIMDGQFVPAFTWNNPKELSSIETDLHLEADLMVMNPTAAILPWLDSKVERIFVQIETFETDKEIRDVIRVAHDRGKEIGLTLNVETPIEKVLPFVLKAISYKLKVSSIDWVLLRGGTPGSYGQPFQNIVLDKIRVLKSRDSLIKIMVDGGLRLDLVRPLKEAGANALAVGSAIFRAPDIQEAIAAFKREAA